MRNRARRRRPPSRRDLERLAQRLENLVRELEADNARLQRIITGFAARIVAQSELLSQRAEKQ